MLSTEIWSRVLKLSVTVSNIKWTLWTYHKVGDWNMTDDHCTFYGI